MLDQGSWLGQEHVGGRDQMIEAAWWAYNWELLGMGSRVKRLLQRSTW